MPLFTKYPTKSKPDDSDTAILYDSTGATKDIKQIAFAGIWNWITSKMASAEISSLATTPKTVIGGINTLKSSVDSANANIASIKGDISDINQFIGFSDSNIVGMCADFKNKSFTRLFAAKGKNGGTDFDAFPMYKLRRCNLANNGTVNAYYGDSGYKEDGSNGQVMVEIPKFYYRVEPIELDNGNAIGYHLRKANFYVSPTPLTGFKVHPAFLDKDGNENKYIYHSAYEGCLYDTSAGKYITDDSQVMDASTDLFCSIANAKPASGLSQNLSKPNIEQLANNRGSDWHCSTVKIEMAITLLMAIEYCTFEFQSKIGNGVVNITDNPNTANNSIVTGGTSALGNKSGMANGTNGYVSVSWRGIENPWGNIWKHVNGVNIWGNGFMQGGQPYIANDFSFNESKNSGNYEAAGFSVTNIGGYSSAFGYGNEKFDWVLLPSECIGGNSSLPIGDYSWITENLNGYRIARLGGSWDDGLPAGRSYWRLSDGVGNRYRNIGGRLAYIKNSAKTA